MIFVVDIDGTVCDSMERVKEIEGFKEVNPDLWTEKLMSEFLSEENIMKDQVMPGAQILFKLAKSCKAPIWFLTGRNEFSIKATRKWLTEVFGASPNAPLIMRPKDWRGITTAECKEKLFLKYIFPYFKNFVFFEDEEETIKMYTYYGLVLKSPDCWKAIGEPDE